MFDNGRKTIGAFISQVTSDFQEALCKGISTQAMERGYNVIFFTNHGGYGQDLYDLGEIQIANIPCYEELDGIILAPDTYSVKGLEDAIRHNIREHANCPVVSVRMRRDEYYNVLIDNDTVIEELIRHFIVNHGFTRINFLAGPKGVEDADKRLACYKRVMEEHNIPIEEDRIYYGDFWRNKPYEAVDYWLQSDLPLPQAIICANDYMAISTLNALDQKGIKVPQQIAISGCDDISGVSECIPSITTTRIPMFEMGIEAVEKIFRHQQKEEQPKNSYLKTIPLYRESCNCSNGNMEESREKRRYDRNRFNQLEKEVNHSGYMSAALTGLTRMDEIYQRLRYYVYENAGFTDFYLSVYPGWQEMNEGSYQDKRIADEEMIMEVGIKNRVDYSQIPFKRKLLIPSEFMDDEPLIYYVSMLHHQQDVFGYAAIRFEEIRTYMLTFQMWMINVGNAFENVRIHRELNRLVYKLEDMYIRDELTSLYNRRALEQLGKKYLEQAQEERATLMVLSADLDDLKIINDRYGHASGDIALKAVANALEYAANDDEICMRCGGDEFIVIGLYYNENKKDQFIEKLNHWLVDFNQKNNHNFKVQVSYGYNLVVPDFDTTVEECMVISDKRMYQQKASKRIRQRPNRK